MSRLAVCVVLSAVALVAEPASKSIEPPKPVAAAKPCNVAVQPATQPPESSWWQLVKATIPVAAGAGLAVLGVWLTNRHNEAMNAANRKHITEENERARQQDLLIHEKDKQREVQLKAVLDQLELMNTIADLVLTTMSDKGEDYSTARFLVNDGREQHKALHQAMFLVQLSGAAKVSTLNDQRWFSFSGTDATHTLWSYAEHFATWRQDLIEAAKADLWITSSPPQQIR